MEKKQSKLKIIGIIVLVLALITAAFFIFRFLKQSKDISITHIPIRIKEDGNWSLLDIKNGKILFEGEFKKKPSIVTEGVFITKNEDGKIFYNKLVDDKKYNQIAGPFKKGENFTEGIAIVCKEDDYVSAINIKGEEIFKLKPQSGTEFLNVGQCFNGMIRFQDQNGFYGFLDKEGKIAIRAQFDYADDFNKEYARVAKNIKDEDKVQIIDKTGKTISELDQSLIGNLDGDLIAYSNSDDEFGVMEIKDDKDKIISASSKYERILLDRNDIFYSSDDEWGLLDSKGEIKIRAKYALLSKLTEDKYLGVKIDGKDRKDVKYEILNKDGDVLKSEDVDYALSLHNGNMLVTDGKDIEIKNENGETVGDAVFKKLDGYDDVERILLGKSNFTESEYFDWDKITSSLKEITSQSMFGIPMSANCTTVDTKLKTLSNNNASSEEKTVSKGLANYGVSIGMLYDEQLYIGSGYKADRKKSSEEATSTDANNTSGYDNSAAAVTEPAVSDISDNAKDWTTYQTVLSESIAAGKNSNINVAFTFDDYIKKSITEQVSVTSYGYTYYDTKVVGYEKNNQAKISYVQITFSVDSEKQEKLQEYLEDFFKKGSFRPNDNQNGYNTSSYGRVFTDSENNYWAFKDNTITFQSDLMSAY
jgi:hypothetical protein